MRVALCLTISLFSFSSFATCIDLDEAKVRGLAAVESEYGRSRETVLETDVLLEVADNLEFNASTNSYRAEADHAEGWYTCSASVEVKCDGASDASFDCWRDD